MIAKITRGHDVGGLLRYLLGPTRDPANVHHDQRVIATSAGIDTRLGQQLTAVERRHLAEQITGPHRVFGADPKGGHVWHLSLTTRADDRDLTDDQWADAVRTTLARVGFDTGDAGAAPTPWAAIRHGRAAGGHDHVHVAVSLVREDGTVASIWQDRVKVAAACQELEARLGLHVVDGRTAGTTPEPSRAEREIAARRRAPEPDRVRLARTVRAAAEASRDEAEFVRRLRGRSLRSRPRYAAGDPSRVVGYSVSTREPDARWWGGGHLAKDLTLPALRQGWQPVADQAAAWRVDRSRADRTIGREARSAPASALATSAQRARHARRTLDSAPAEDRDTWSDAARSTAGIYAALATCHGHQAHAPLAQAARLLAHSAQRGPRRRRVGPSPLSGIATSVLQADATIGPAWTPLLIQLTRLAGAIAQAHRARGERDRARQLEAASANAAAALAKAAAGRVRSIEPTHARRQDHEPER